jgi:MFS family permease
MRLWRVAGVLFLIGAEALLFGYSYPFFSLALEKRELANWLIGLNASVAGAGILFVGPFLPRLIDMFGLRRLVAAQFAISALSFLAILVFDSIPVWFVARLVMGACFSALWTTTEIWLNGVVDDRHRGRIVGASGTLYAGCQFVGPLILSVTGAAGSLPLIVPIIPLVVGALVAISIPSAVGEAEEDGASVEGLVAAITMTGALVGAAFLSGVGETAMQALLPLYGLANGWTETEAPTLVAAFSLGEAVLIAALGWMADRFGRIRTLQLCAIVATATCLALPLAIANSLLAAPLLFAAGGTISGIYTLGVILIGQDFRGQRLAVVSTGFGMAYSAGSIIGATPIGFAIDLFGPNALPISIAIGFAALTIYLLQRQRRPVVQS